MKQLCIRTLVFVLAALNAVILVSCVPVTYSCAGSSACKNLPQSDCDAARSKIDAGHLYDTRHTAKETGVCSGHCGLFVSGRNCDLSGTEMIVAFNKLRARNCAKCGIKTYDDGCQFKADFVSRC